MSRRNLINLILLVVMAVLVSIVVYEPGIEESEPVKLTGLARADIHKITIDRIGSRTVVLEKEQDRWYLREPYAMPANAFKAEAIIEIVAAESQAQYPLADQDLKPYGLDAPRVTVVFNDQQRIEFGGSEPLKHRRYMRYGDTLHVVTDRFMHNLSVTETDYIDHSLFPSKPTITRLVLPDLTLTFKDGTWQTEPAVADYSNDQGNELIDNWLTANALQITDYQADGARPQVQIYLQDEETPIIFDILRDKEFFSLGRADLGLQFKFTANKANDLLKLPAKINADVLETPDIPQPAAE